VFIGEAIHINITVFGLTRLGIEPTIYHTWGEHANHYTTDMVHMRLKEGQIILIYYISHYFFRTFQKGRTDTSQKQKGIMTMGQMAERGEIYVL
jgi:predicted lactoylglutathione lyase